jgi:hypothetical protein
MNDNRTRGGGVHLSWFTLPCLIPTKQQGVLTKVLPRNRLGKHKSSANQAAMSLLPRLRPVSASRQTLQIPFRRTLIPQPPIPLVTPRPLPTTVKASSPDMQANKANMDTLVENMNALQAKAREGGGAAVLEKWKSRGKGKLSARERYVHEWLE